MNAPVSHRFPADLRSSLGIAIDVAGGAFRVRLDLKNMLLTSTSLSGPQVVGIDPATGETRLYPYSSGGGGTPLPDGGEVGNVLGLISKNPRVTGWLAAPGISFGQTAGTAAEGNDARIVGAMQKAQNGADIPNVVAFRSALGLKSGALAAVGTTSGTVAAGDDSRFPTQPLGPAAYRSVGSSAGTVAAGDDPRFSQSADVSGKVDKADPQMAKPPRVTAADVASAFDPQTGVLNVGYLPGVDSSGLTDSWAPVQAALNFLAIRVGTDTILGFGPRRLGGILQFPHGGRYRFDKPLTYDSDGFLTIRGGDGLGRKSAKLVQNSPTLFSIVNTRQKTASFPYDASESGMNQVEIGGLEIDCAEGGNGGTCFRIENPESAYVHDIRASKAGGGWAYFFDLLNVRGAYFERMYVRNDTNGDDFSGRFLNMKATNGTTDSRYCDMTIQGFEYGFFATLDSAKAIEGQLFNGVTFLGCDYGIRYVCPNNVGAYSPQLQFLNGHMNVFKKFFWLEKISGFILSDCHMELNHRRGNTDPGIHLVDVIRWHIHDITYIEDGGASRSSPRILCQGQTYQGSVHDITAHLTATNTAFIVTEANTYNNTFHDIRILNFGNGNIAYANLGSNTNLFRDVYTYRFGDPPPATDVPKVPYGNSYVGTYGTAGATWDFVVGLPSGRFATTPVATASLTGDPGYFARVSYMRDSSDKDNLRFRIVRNDGQPLGNGAAFRVDIIATDPT